MLIRKILKNRYLKILIFSGLGTLLFFGIMPLIDFVLQNYILKLFNFVSPNAFLDILFILIALILLATFINRLIINYYHSIIHSIFIITTSLLYLFVRIYVQNIEFIGLSFYYKAAYLDIIPLYGSFSIVLLARNFLSEIYLDKTKSTLSGFISDSPWQKGEKDLLNRLPLAKLVANHINEYESTNSFSIGIIGKWGDGKTSFFNQIKTFLNLDSYILIDFTPWNYGHTKNIIESYFSIFSSSLNQYSSEIDDLVRKYVNLLSQNSNPGYSFFASLFTSDIESFNQYYSKLNATIKHINKKILVFIDDLDRMNETEVLEIFKIIRQSSNFNNVVFLVGYDRNYISQVISGNIKSNPDVYIDKIFQLEYQLPPIDKIIIEDALKDYLKNCLPTYEADIKMAIDTGRNEIGKVVAESVSFINPAIGTYNYLTSLVTNLRDVKKIANSIILQKTNIENLDLGELLLLNLIKTRCFILYQNIANQSVLKIKKETDRSKLIIDQTTFDQIVEKTNPDSKILKQICEDIFNKDKSYIKSIVFPNNFNNYFDIASESILPLNMFNTLRLKKFKYLQKGIRKSCRDKKEGEVLLMIDGVTQYTNKQDFENILRAKILLILLSIKDFSENIIQSIDLTKNPDLLGRLYSGKGGMMKDTLVRIFLKKCENPFFNNLLHAVHQHFNYDKNFKIALSKEEFVKICIDRFERHLNYYKGINLKTFQYYYRCINTIGEDSMVNIDPRANELMHQRVLLKPIEYLKIVIVDLYTPPDDITFSLEGFAKQVFGDWSGFEAFLEQQEKTNNIVLVVKEFYGLFKQTNYKGVRVGPDMQKKIIQIRHR